MPHTETPHAETTETPRPLSFNQDLQLLREWIVQTQGERRVQIPGWTGLEFETRPDVPRLERALTAIVERHESLRTSMTDPSTIDASMKSEMFRRRDELTIHESLFAQQVHPAMPITVSEGALDGLQRDWVSGTLDHPLLRSEVHNHFRYDAPPHLRATLYRCDGSRHLLGITLPHLVTDGWSMRVFRRELAALYGRSSTDGASVSLPPLEAQYADFALWQRQQLATACDEAIGYWRARYREFLPALAGLAEIPYASREPAPTSESGRVARAVDAAFTKELRAFCKQHGVTMFVAWLAATALTLRLYSGRERVALLGYASNRTQAAWRSLIGWVSNPVLWGLSVPATSGEAALREARQTVLDAMRYQIVPMGFTWKALIRDGSLAPNFYMKDWVSLDYTTVPRESRSEEPWTRPIWSYVLGTHRGPSLALRVTDEGTALTLVCAYPLARFAAADAAQVLRDIQSVMHALIRAPHEPVDAYRHVLGTSAVQAN